VEAMRTIAFVSERGGSGKSTIVASLAAAAHETGDKVCVIDMDPQGSLMNWATIRASRDIGVIACGGARLPALLASLEGMGVTLAILDAPGAEGAASTAAMRAADLNIAPSRPSLFDLRASARTRTALEEIGAYMTSCSCSISARLANRPPTSGTAPRRWPRWAN
jgi:chromosome partitioning protein